MRRRASCIGVNLGSDFARLNTKLPAARCRLLRGRFAAMPALIASVATIAPPEGE